MKLATLSAAGGIALSVASGCGSDEPCDVALQTGCSDGLVCEAVEGGEPACFAPLFVSGSVFDLASDAPVADARVVALDVNGAAQSAVAVTGVDGGYDLAVSTTRHDDGTPVGLDITLRVDAAGYQSFPGGVRQALPIDTGAAVAEEGGGYRVESPLTEVGLIALGADAGTGVLAGHVETPTGTGVLVVAESAGVGYSAIADRDGDYAIFNLPDGSYEVTAYAQGYNYAPATVDVGGEHQLDLSIADEDAGAVEGNISIVETAGQTSVVLVVESTYSESLGRGQTVPGLRAPEPGIAGNVTSGYRIAGVPAGRYVVLGAFENDDLVRDPDTSIAGTATLHIEVEAGQTTTVEGFKINEALHIMGPGAAGAEAAPAMPTFSWVDDSSEKSYVVQLYDTFGDLVWESNMPGVSGADPSLAYDGAALEAGMYYQFRVTSLDADAVPLARSEDLEGVFWVE